MLPIWMSGVLVQEGKREIDRNHDVSDQVKNGFERDFSTLGYFTNN